MHAYQLLVTIMLCLAVAAASRGVMIRRNKTAKRIPFLTASMRERPRETERGSGAYEYPNFKTYFHLLLFFSDSALGTVERVGSQFFIAHGGKQIEL